MSGVTGREMKVAWARATTWGSAASVTRGILLMSSDGIDDKPKLVDDDAFNQQFRGEAEVGDRDPVSTELKATMRFEGIDSWLAQAMGSVAAPTVVSSIAASSLVAYSHVITLSDELTHFSTLAFDFTQYIAEVPTFRLRGFTISVGSEGRLDISFPIVGSRVVYDSTINTNSTVGGATAATIGNRAMRKNARIRLNAQGASALGGGDVLSLVKDFQLSYSRPLAQDDHVVGDDVIAEPDDDGFAEMEFQLNFARMNTISANSMAIAFGAGSTFKGDLLLNGPYINSTTRRSLTLEMPALQAYDFKAPVTGHNQVRPSVTLRMKRAASAPSGMAFTAPLRATLINANSANLLA